MPAPHPAIVGKNLAIITGGASGIGFAAAKALSSTWGMHVAIGDVAGNLNSVSEGLQKHAQNGVKVWASHVDVGDKVSLEKFRDDVQQYVSVSVSGHDMKEAYTIHTSAFPDIPLTVLMANAGVSGPTKASDWSGWDRVFHTNLYGPIFTVQTFLGHIKAHGKPSLIINTGSKQGITTPPMTGPAYNASKAVVKVFTEQLAWELRSETATKHIEPKLLIPGFVFTGLSGANKPDAQKPQGAWTPEQTVEFMWEAIEKGSFYVLCPDDETPRETDLKRIEWNANDILQDRPALSRWHPQHTDAFRKYDTSKWT